MSNKEHLVEFEGVVVDVLPNNLFKVKVSETDHILICYLGGKLKQNKIRVILNDCVKIETSIYDLNKGRIVWRS